MANEIGFIVGMGASALGLLTVAASIGNGSRSENRPSPTPAPIPPKKKPITGRDRDLIGAQRARIAAAYARQNTVAAPQAPQLNPDDAFGEWFCASFVVPENPGQDDYAPWEEWSAHYLAHCARMGWRPLSDQEMLDAILSYATAYHCRVDQNTGDFIGGRLKNPQGA